MAGFRPFVGEYEKRWYDVLLSDGTTVKHCWPNAGILNSTDGTGRQWGVNDFVNFKESETHPLDEYMKEKANAQ